ncbi:MAG: hypothetical protein ACON5F_09405 [Jejuia sp.]
MAIKNKTKKKRKSMGLLGIPNKNAVFNMTHKLRLRDAIVWHPENRTIDYLIKYEPEHLWHRIHNKKDNETSIRLVSTAYEKLKESVKKINPALIEDLNNKKKNLNDLKNLKQALKNGKNVDSLGRFKKIDSKKVID